MGENIKKLSITLLLSLILFGCTSNPIFSLIPDPTATTTNVTGVSGHLKYGIPSTNGTCLTRTGYVLLHDSTKKEPLWVSYDLTASHLSGPATRTDNYKADPALPVGQRAELSDYSGSGYDRGHMCPAADNYYSITAMNECFYLSNMCPQNGSINSGKWASLESQIRTFTATKGECWIICGPIFSGTISTIGSNQVAVPSSFYKIVVYASGSGVEAAGFVMPNASSSNALSSYLTKIDDIEALTGLDFLNALSVSDQALIEGSIPSNTEVLR